MGTLGCRLVALIAASIILSAAMASAATGPNISRIHAPIAAPTEHEKPDHCLQSQANGLRVERANPNVVLRWNSSASPSTQWNVYYSNNRFAAFPSGWTQASAASTSRSWTHAGAHGDGKTWYYIVRGNSGGTLSANSTMGVKLHKSLEHNSMNTNINWFSLPYNSMYKRACDVVKDLEGGDGVYSPSTKINVVGLWIPQYQAGTGYLHDEIFGEWTGDDFAIPPGAGICVSVVSAFAWIINGTDSSTELAFVHNEARTNVMLFSMPYTARYAKASDVVLALEGALIGPGLDTKINCVGRWYFPSQMMEALVYDSDFEEWTGYDFDIIPGGGYYISVTSDFAWTPELLTPEVP